MSLNEIRETLKKMANAEKTAGIKDVTTSLEKLATLSKKNDNETKYAADVQKAAEALVKKAFMGFGDDEGDDKESVIELIKQYIAENPDVAAALGLGAAGAGIGGLAGGLMGGDALSALLGAGAGGAAGGAAGYFGGEDLMNAFASADDYTKGLIADAVMRKTASANDVNDELIKQAAYTAAVEEVQDELIKQAAFEDALAEVAAELNASQNTELNKQAAVDAFADALIEEMQKKAALEQIAALLNR